MTKTTILLARLLPPLLLLLGAVQTFSSNNIRNWREFDDEDDDVVRPDPVEMFADDLLGNADRQRRFAGERENLCDRECVCSAVGGFLTVQCNFLLSRKYVLGGAFYIPPKSSALLISLAESAELRIDERFFANNKVNRLQIRGSSTGTEHIEISQNALHGNRGLYPEIDISDCYTLILRENAFVGEFTMNVTNFKEVIVFPSAFRNTNFRVFFKNIDDLRIFQNAFSGSNHSRVNIDRANIGTLQAIDASLKEISINHSTIEKISNSTFNVNHIGSLVLENSRIDLIESRAITEKLYCKYLAVINCQIERIETAAISGSGVNQFLFEENRVETIENEAIDFTAILISVQRNNVKHLGYSWLKVKEWSNVTIFNNTLGNFDGIQIGRTANPVQCLFGRNFITKPAPDSLNFRNSHCRIQDVSFYTLCSCNLTWLRELSVQDITSESFCRLDDTLRHCFNSTTFNVAKYGTLVCDTSRQKLDCLQSAKARKVDGQFLTPEEIDAERRRRDRFYIVVGTVVGGFLLLVIVALAIAAMVRRKRRRKAEADISLLGAALPSLKRSKKISETDREIILETMAMMKRTQPPERYDRVLTSTRQLLESGLGEAERVACIRTIVETLEQCDNMGRDYMGFASILDRILGPMEADEEEDEVAVNEENLERERNAHEHIYAEPTCIRHPLLNSDYSLPIDRNEGLYSEPIQKSKGPSNGLASPYAVGNATEVTLLPPSTNNHSIPSSSKNLPDILNNPLSSEKSIPSYSRPIPAARSTGTGGGASVSSVKPDAASLKKVNRM